MGGMKDLFGDEYYEQRKPVTTAEHLRDEGIARVTNNSGDWFGRALVVVANLEHGWVGTGEEIRHVIEGKLEKPHHHNVWGGVARQAIRLGLLVRTGRRLKMRDARSHARLTDEYRRT